MQRGAIRRNGSAVCCGCQSDDLHHGTEVARRQQWNHNGDALFSGNMVYPFYIGDSRIYLYNGTDLYRLTSDHTLANHKLKTGIYTKEEAELSSDRNKLTQFLGADLKHFSLPKAAQPPLRFIVAIDFCFAQMV